MNIDDSESAIASQKKPAIIPLFELIKIGGKNGYEEIALLYTRAGPPPLSNIHDRPRRLSPLLFSYFFPFYSLASSQFSRLFDTGHSFQRGPIRMKGLSCRSANSQQPQQSSRFSSFRCLAVPVPRRIRKVGTIK